MKNLPILILLAFALISTTGCKKAVCVPEINKTDKSKYLSVRRSGNEIIIFNNSTSKILISRYKEYLPNTTTLNDYGWSQEKYTIGVWLSKKFPIDPNTHAVLIPFHRWDCETYTGNEQSEYGYYSF